MWLSKVCSTDQFYSQHYLWLWERRVSWPDRFLLVLLLFLHPLLATTRPIYTLSYLRYSSRRGLAFGSVPSLLLVIVLVMRSILYRCS